MCGRRKSDVEANVRRTLLSQLWLSLLDRSHDHVTRTGGRQSVQSSTDTLDGDDVEVSRARVVGAGHDRTTRKAQLSALFSSINPRSFESHVSVNAFRMGTQSRN